MSSLTVFMFCNHTKDKWIGAGQLNLAFEFTKNIGVFCLLFIRIVYISVYMYLFHLHWCLTAHKLTSHGLWVYSLSLCDGYTSTHTSACRERSPVGTSAEARHNYDRFLAIETFNPQLFKRSGGRPNAASTQKHNANVWWLMHTGCPEASTVMHIMMSAIFDFASHALCNYSTIYLQGNNCIHNTLSLAQATNVTVHFRLSQMAFAPAQLHLGYFPLI